MSIRIRRMLVSFHLTMLASFIVFFEWNDRVGPDTTLIAIAVASFVLLLITFYLLFFRTGLWQFTHRKWEKHDEREKELAFISLKYSYPIFAIAILIILYTYSLTHRQVGLFMSVGLIYFAQIMPSVVLAWRQKRGESFKDDYERE